MNLKNISLVAGAALLLAAVGCDPYVETSPGLPAPPTADVQWYFLPDTVDGVIGIDSNRVVVEAEASEDVFIHLWDFGNGQISNDPVDTMVYYVEGTYAITYQGHAEGGMAYFADSVKIEKTLELPCEGTLALLTGCDNPKTWKFASDAGAIAIGPEPGSTEWYASPAGALVDFQYDDRWTLTEDGQFLYNNNGGTMNPFDGYIETLMTVQPSTYMLELRRDPMKDLFTVGGLTTEVSEICGWMGVWDSGPTTIMKSRGSVGLECLATGWRLCQPLGSGYFTLIFAQNEFIQAVECVARWLDSPCWLWGAPIVEAPRSRSMRRSSSWPTARCWRTRSTAPSGSKSVWTRRTRKK